MTDLVGRRLGEFEVVRELGRGGMGVVYEAVQTSLRRRVALKVLGPGLGLTPRAVDRFRREAAAAARLHHTNIVPVYATGEDNGFHFYAMELVDGPSLDRVIADLASGGREPPVSAGPKQGADAPRSPEPDNLALTGPYVEAPPSPAPFAVASSGLSSGGGYFDAVARMVADVADALDHAHKQGILHRDIKPSNLLLAPDGRLSVNDFGLARVLEEPGVTVTGEFVGTPAYTAPEQVAGGRVPVDARADVYSLGATLYELLTLRRPFVALGRDQLLAAVLQKDPVPPRRVNPRVPKDLETVCLKCLEKDPDRRYASAGELAADLRRYVSRFAILARRPGRVARAGKWVRRNPAVVASLGCLLVAACAALGFAYQAHLAEQRRLSDQALARSQLLEEKIRAAYQVAAAGDPLRTEEAIREVEAHGGSTGQVRLLRGVAAFFRSDTAAAIAELEQAARLLPDSVAARVLLATAYTDNGQYERYEQLVREAEQLPATTPEDYLFRGYSRQGNEAGQGLPDLNEGIRRGDSPLGRTLRAIVRANRAIDVADHREAEGAVADADAARGMLPDNPFVVYASLYARLAAAGCYQDNGLPDERRRVLKEAAKDVQALGPTIGLPNTGYVLWLYYDEVGDPDRALDAARRSLDQSGNSQAAYFAAVSLHRKGLYTDALGSLGLRRQPDMQCDLTRAFILSELPDGPRRAYDDYAKTAALYQHDLWDAKYRGELLLFLGRRDEAAAVLRGFRPPLALSGEWRAFYEAMSRFNRGELSEEAYLATAGTSRWRRAWAYRQAGIFRLSRGDRAGARNHFRQVVATRTIWYYEWVWARMFLDRMEQDPAWPPWIPAAPPKP